MLAHRTRRRLTSAKGVESSQPSGPHSRHASRPSCKRGRRNPYRKRVSARIATSASGRLGVETPEQTIRAKMLPHVVNRHGAQGLSAKLHALKRTGLARGFTRWLLVDCHVLWPWKGEDMLGSRSPMVDFRTLVFAKCAPHRGHVDPFPNTIRATAWLPQKCHSTILQCPQS